MYLCLTEILAELCTLLQICSLEMCTLHMLQYYIFSDIEVFDNNIVLRYIFCQYRMALIPVSLLPVLYEDDVQDYSEFIQ